MTENSVYQENEQALHCGLVVRKATSGTSAPFYSIVNIERKKNVPIPMDKNTIYSVYSFDTLKKFPAVEDIIVQTNLGNFSESETTELLSNLFGMRLTVPSNLEKGAIA